MNDISMNTIEFMLFPFTLSYNTNLLATSMAEIMPSEHHFIIFLIGILKKDFSLHICEGNSIEKQQLI